MTTVVAWWHCFSGIAGDMALGSLLDAGADLDDVRAGLDGLGLDGWTLDAEPVTRGGLAATRAVVGIDEAAGGSRTWADIAALLAAADLPERARARAVAAFGALAAAEGRVHRQAPADVHFHEVGGLDAIVDIVGTCLALDHLGVDEIRASPVAQGTGQVRSAHGLLPVPAPAVIELLHGAPTYGTGRPVELTTPTGAALLAGLGSGWGPLPAMTVTASGRGAGGRDLDGLPNVVAVVVGTAADRQGHDGGQPVVIVETNVDDVTGEVLGHLVPSLIAAGAHDAWITPVIGKKGRPASVVTALTAEEAVAAVRAVLVAETGTLGVRATPATRWTAARTMVEASVDGHPVAVKVSAARAKAEHDDAARVAAATGRPVRVVAALAEADAVDRMARPPGA